MSSRKEFGIDPEKTMAIVDHFRAADLLYPTDPHALDNFYTAYIRKFGHINFAMLERIFRENNFNTHFLAVPTHIIVERSSHGMIIADANDIVLKQKITPRPFAALTFSSREGLDQFAKNYGVIYNPQLNLQRLHISGCYVPRSVPSQQVNSQLN
jgi:hypothetical protein